jgi:hypothetical protein
MGLYDKAKLRPAEQHIALLDLDFSWYLHEVERVADLWRQGVPLVEIAAEVRGGGQDAVDETALLVWDMARRGKVERRDGGVYGASSILFGG